MGSGPPARGDGATRHRVAVVAAPWTDGVSSLCLFWITQVKCGSPESSIPAYLPTVFSSSDERSVQKHAGGL